MAAVTYERRGAAGWITLNRPDARNAQNQAMTYGLDDAFRQLADDDDADVGVIVGAGEHFSAGHDVTAADLGDDYERRASLWWDHKGEDRPCSEWIMAFESEQYLGMCRRWREIPKPTIAMVRGACVGGGLALAWVCDLIVADTSAFFADPVLAMGCPGIEFFAHPWELGTRAAKEFLFLGERMSATDALRLGMVNRVVEPGDLETEVQSMVARAAQRPRFALALAKQAVNQCQEAAGFRAGIDGAFALHQLSHAHNQATTGRPVLVQEAAQLKEHTDGGSSS